MDRVEKIARDVPPVPKFASTRKANVFLCFAIPFGFKSTISAGDFFSSGQNQSSVGRFLLPVSKVEAVSKLRTRRDLTSPPEVSSRSVHLRFVDLVQQKVDLRRRLAQLATKSSWKTARVHSCNFRPKNSMRMRWYLRCQKWAHACDVAFLEFQVVRTHDPRPPGN